MKSIVVHIMDSVCAKNNRDPEAASLIEAARTFGTVETLDSALAAEKSKYQAELNRLNAQHEAKEDELNAKIASIEENAVTPDELDVLRALRAKSTREAQHYESTIAERDAQLQSIKTESENRAAQIAAMFGFSK